jgi:magnesium chelatase family protein
MLAKVISCAVVGLDAAPVQVEVDIGYGLPSVTIVGLPMPRSARAKNESARPFAIPA